MRLKPLLLSVQQCILLLSLIDCLSAIRVYTGTKHEDEYRRMDGRRSSDDKSSNEWIPINVNLVKDKGAATDTVSTWRRSDDFSQDEPTSKAKPSPLLYKIKLTQKGYIQFLKYLVDVPPLQDFTFCLWLKSVNLTHDHPILSYSKNEKERLVRSWISPKEQTLNLYIKEEPVFKIPFPMKENRWYHICESFSGFTGQWIVFIDGKNRGTGILKQMQGTFVPGGGDLVVGQEYTDFNKGLDDGIEGEIFGFNMADEAVSLEDENNLNYAHNTPHVVTSSETARHIPPFKRLPPSKKTFQDIKRYIDTLPKVDFSTTGAGLGDATEPTGTEVPLPPVRSRTDKQRSRKPPPMRKVVVYYNRNDRMLDVGTNMKRTGLPAVDATDYKTRINDIEPSVSKSLHTYKVPKTTHSKVPSPYQIHEDYEDHEEENKTVPEDSPQVREIFKEEPKDKISNKSRRARYDNNLGQFSLNLTREANKRYPFTSHVSSKNRPKYHFETLPMQEAKKIIPTTEKYEKIKRIENSRTPIQFRSDVQKISSAQRRNFDVEQPTRRISTVRKTIPVYELTEEEIPRSRRNRRQTPQELEGDMLGTFKRMPRIPTDFFKTVLEDKNETLLEQYFPKNKTQAEKIQELLDGFDFGKVAKDELVPVSGLQIVVPEIQGNVEWPAENIHESVQNVPKGETIQALPSEQNLQIVHNIPNVQALHVIQNISTVQALPSAQNIPTVQAIPVVQNIPTVQALPTPQNIPTVRVLPVVQNIPMVQALPVVQNIPTVQALPMVKNIPMVQAHHVAPKIPTIQALPTLQTVQKISPSPSNLVETTTKGDTKLHPVHREHLGKNHQVTTSAHNSVSDRLDLTNDIMSSGTELVIRSYALCSVDRGSPVSNKKHLIVAWSSTPVRIYGGAVVGNAKNICGLF